MNKHDERKRSWPKMHCSPAMTSAHFSKTKKYITMCDIISNNDRRKGYYHCPAQTNAD